MAIAQRGIADGSAAFADAGGQLAQSLDPQAIVDMKLAQAQVEASVAVARSADDMLGHLIDALA